MSHFRDPLSLVRPSSPDADWDDDDALRRSNPQTNAAAADLEQFGGETIAFNAEQHVRPMSTNLESAFIVLFFARPSC
jgi:hypothetical protein